MTIKRLQLTVCVACLMGALSCGDDVTEKIVEETLEACGPCGEVKLGDSTISGDARIDGFFKAVGTLGSATAKIESDFRAQVQELAAAFQVDVEGMALDEMVAAVKAEIEAEISASVSGSLRVEYAPPKCSANLNVAVEAQAGCEAKAGCEVDAECASGELAVLCEGQCTGGCSGTCEGGCAVEIHGACEGTCRGTCTVEGGLECGGTCKGACNGECELQHANGDCEGECSGSCEGVCEMHGGGSCDGECHGECVASASGSCEGTCEGSCSGECSGGCEGTATPPSCSLAGNCEASADCQASASAQASASLECTPPALEISYAFDASLDADAQAEFVAKMEAFKVQMIAIAQGMTELRALVDADYAADLGIEPPIVLLQGQIEGLISADIDDFDVAVGLIPCVIPALEDSLSIIGDVAIGTVVTIQGQVELFAIIG
jgi:hypothetical protein